MSPIYRIVGRFTGMYCLLEHNKYLVDDIEKFLENRRLNNYYGLGSLAVKGSSMYVASCVLWPVFWPLEIGNKFYQKLKE